MKIAFLGDSINYVTAYAKVANGMVRGMQKLGHECVSVSLQWTGAPGMHEGITVYPASDAQSMERSIMEAKADVVISVRDAWVHTQRWYSGPGRTPYNVKAWTSRYGGKAIVYSPVQSDPLPSDFVATVNDASDFFYTGGSVYVTGTTDGIPDGSLVSVYTSLSSAPVTQAAVVNGGFSAGLVFSENSSTETETIAVDASF